MRMHTHIAPTLVLSKSLVAISHHRTGHRRSPAHLRHVRPHLVDVHGWQTSGRHRTRLMHLVELRVQTVKSHKCCASSNVNHPIPPPFLRIRGAHARIRAAISDLLQRRLFRVHLGIMIGHPKSTTLTLSKPVLKATLFPLYVCVRNMLPVSHSTRPWELVLVHHCTPDRRAALQAP